MAARASVVQGFLLHSKAYQESNFLCDILTPEFGLIRCKFNGNRPEYFRQFQTKLLEQGSFFSCSDFSYVQPLLISDSPARLYGLYLNELSFYLLPRRIETGDFYGTYASSLINIQSKNSILPSLRFFEKQLLSVVGSAIDYQRSSDGLLIAEDERYRFEPSVGFVADETGAFTGRAIAANHLNRYDEKGALALARHCQYLQISALLAEQSINSRDWIKLLQPNVEARS
jgi:DNA repair protein RecO (recombination protein O)